MATREEYDRAVGNVASGHGSKRDYELCHKQAKVAGWEGSAAREALKGASKN